MKKTDYFTKSLVLLLIFTILFQSCVNNDVNDTAKPPILNAIRLATNATFGQILTDTDGNSLYFFSKDTKDNSECLGGCRDIWPVIFVENLTVDNGLDILDFATITRTDGALQTTYKGWLLYYFGQNT